MVMDNPADVGLRTDTRTTGWPDNSIDDSLYALVKQAIQESREAENHVHNRERWCGILVPQTATEWAEVDGLVPYIAVSGNNDFGAAIQILGTADTPILSGYSRYDSDRLLIVDFENATPWYIRLIWGTGNAADAEVANQFSDVTAMAADPGPPIRPQGNIVTCKMPRLRAGIDKLWAKTKNATLNDEIDFFIGTHEYNDP